MKLLTLTLVLTASVAVAQTSLDSLILDQVNSYRAEYGLPAMRFEARLMQVAENQAEYSARLGQVRHDQDADAEGFDEEPVFVKRFTRVGIDTTSGCSVQAEIMAGIADTASVLTNDQLAKMIVDGWKASPEHDEILRVRQFVDVGISVKVGDSMMNYAMDLDGTLYETGFVGRSYFVSLDTANEDVCH